MSKFFAIFFSLMIVLINSGCFVNPSVSIDDLGIDIPKEWSVPIYKSSVTKVDWLSSFDDEELNRYIETVKTESPDFLSIIENKKIGQFNANIKGSAIFPSVNLGYNSSESRQNLSAFGFADSFLNPQESDSSSQNFGSDDEVISFENKTFGFGFNYQWEVDVWGRLLNERKAARKDYEALKYDLSYLGFSLVVRSAILYYQGVEALAQSELSKESYNSLVDIRDLVKDRYKKGLRPSLDYRLAETSVSTAILEMESKKNQLVRINRQLEILSGKYPSGVLLEQNKLPTNLPNIPANIPAAIVERRPDIRSLFLKVESNVNRVAQAKRNLLPGLMLTGSLGLLPSASLGIKDKNGRTRSLYEPVHGSAPDIEGQNIANPIATILSFAMALKYSLDLDKESEILEKAVQEVLDEGLRTKDILSKGTKEVSTTQMGDAIISKLK